MTYGTNIKALPLSTPRTARHSPHRTRYGICSRWGRMSIGRWAVYRWDSWPLPRTVIACPDELEAWGCREPDPGERRSLRPRHRPGDLDGPG